MSLSFLSEKLEGERKRRRSELEFGDLGLGRKICERMDLDFRQLPQPMSTEVKLTRSFFLTAAIMGGGGGGESRGMAEGK